MSGGHKRRGQSLVEFALVLPLLVLIVFGVLDLGRAFYALITITNAAREGARYGITNLDLSHGMSLGERDLIISGTKDEIANTDFAIDKTKLVVDPTCDPYPCAAGGALRVDVTYPFNSIINTVFFGVLFPSNIDMTRSIEMVIP